MSKINICPTCKKESDFSSSNIYRPFCSKRCKLVDLGQWINGTYSISDNSSNADNIDLTSIEDVKH